MKIEIVRMELVCEIAGISLTRIFGNLGEKKHHNQKRYIINRPASLVVGSWIDYDSFNRLGCSEVKAEEELDKYLRKFEAFEGGG